LPEPWSPTPSTTSGCAAAIAPPSPSFIMCVSGLRAEDFCLSGKHRSLLCLLAEAEISPGGLLPYPGSPLPFLAKQLARTSGSLEPVAAIRRKPGRSTASHALPANVKLESSNLPTPFSMSVSCCLFNLYLSHLFTYLSYMIMFYLDTMISIYNACAVPSCRSIS
jgi:hypothetical protein